MLIALGLGLHLVVLLGVAMLAGAGAELFTLGWNLAMQGTYDNRGSARLTPALAVALSRPGRRAAP